MINKIDCILHIMPQLMRGMLVTLQLWAGAAVMGLSIGLLLGIVSCRKLRIPGVSILLNSITFVVRAIPFYVQLLIMYFVFPELIGINVTQNSAGILALGICSAAYSAQIVKVGINNISDGQWDAAQIVGLSKVLTLRYIIMPQMLNNVLPALLNELEHLLKSTAVISSIGVIELTRSGMNIISRGGDPIIMYGLVALLYFVCSLLFNSVSKIVAYTMLYKSVHK